MNPQELRIGNWVESNQFGRCQITEISTKHCSLEIINPFGNKEGDVAHSYDEIKPITLTEEEVTKFGFEQDERYASLWAFDTNSPQRSGLIISKGCKGNFFLNTNQHGIILKYVHELQNLYFTLERLELKQIQ